jgi:hypothetical protein
MKLFRAMREAADGLPEVEPSSRGLGVRPGPGRNSDVSAVSGQDAVMPGGGGMSVAPDDPLHLVSFRRPRSLGGTGRDPVWVIDVADLGPELTVRPDAPGHAFVEPARLMTLQSFQQALAVTRDRWVLVAR